MEHTKKTKAVSETRTALPTFADHIQELRSRLFYIALAFVVSAGAAYPFFDKLVAILTKPLGNTELYYLTPAGGLSFIIKVCMYVGFVGMLPVAVYQLHRFIAPIMKRHHSRAIMGYTLASTFLAMAGVAFAYFISLPAALHFLTGIELMDIKAMLTIDAYMSFIGAYLLAGALLFQLPLILLLINSVTPTPPSKLLKFERHIIVVSFVFAALVSPTPDIINQSILALPIVATYQIGIVAVWFQQRSTRRKLATTMQKATKTAAKDLHASRQELKAIGSLVAALHVEKSVLQLAEPKQQGAVPVQPKTMDVMPPAHARAQYKSATYEKRSAPKPVVRYSTKSIDGFLAPQTA